MSKPEEKKPVTQNVKRIEVTEDNAAKLTVHFLERIHGRLGYLIKLLEGEKK